MTFNDLSFDVVAIAISTIAMTGIGALWFNAPFLFQPLWLRSIGKSAEQVIEEFSPINPLLSLMGSIILSIMLTLLQTWSGVMSAMDALLLGAILACFAIIPNGVRDAFEGRPLVLYAINATHDIMIILVGSLIIYGV